MGDKGAVCLFPAHLLLSQSYNMIATYLPECASECTPSSYIHEDIAISIDLWVIVRPSSYHALFIDH